MTMTHQLEHHGISICYETFGEPSNPCIILIMGVGGQLIHWPIEITEGLANEGFFVVTFDNRDVGFSSYYDHLHTPSILEALQAKQSGKTFHPPYTLHSMASDIHVLMDGLGLKKAHIVGISMGGMIAQIFALEYPEYAASLTCIASTTGDSHMTQAKPEILEFFFSQSPVADLESYVDTMMKVTRMHNYAGHVNEARMRELFQRAYQRSYHPSGFTRQMLATICAAARTERLKRLKIPSLIIHGDYDPVFPLEHGKQLSECLEFSQFKVIENLGHGLPECMNENFVELISEFAGKERK